MLVSPCVCGCARLFVLTLCISSVDAKKGFLLSLCCEPLNAK